MSPEAQRIAIAEACGWKGPQHPETLERIKNFVHKAATWLIDPHGKLQSLLYVPDYLNDLNAMHEAEKFLPSARIYHSHLQRVCADPAKPYVASLSEIIQATAAQRAEAFLCAIGKWDDSK